MLLLFSAAAMTGPAHCFIADGATAEPLGAPMGAKNVTVCDEKNDLKHVAANSHAAQPTEVAMAFLEYWKTGDLDACIALLAPDAVYTLHIEETLLPFAGTTRGREQIGEQFRTMLREWDYLVFRPSPAKQHVDQPNRVNSRVEFIYRHKASGEDLAGFMRIAWTIEDGMIRAIDGYHDSALVEAFLRLIATQND